MCKLKGVMFLALVIMLMTYSCAKPGRSELLAFRNVRVFDGEKTHKHVTVVVENGRIKHMGADLRIPVGAHVIGGEGQTLLPGMIDSHVHIGPGGLRRALMFGVTTELTMDDDPELVATFKQEQLEGSAQNYADFFSAGWAATSPGGHGTQFSSNHATLDREEDADAFVKSRVDEGSDYIKIIYPGGSSERGPGWTPQITEPTMRAVVAAAHRHGKLALVHINTLEAAKEVAEAGADGLAHIFTDKVVDEELTKLIIEKGMFVIPTFTVYEGMWGSSPWGAHLASDPRVSSYLAPNEIGYLSTHGGKENQRWPKLWSNMVESVQILHQKGVPILAGTDVWALEGVCLHRELESLVLAGLNPEEALASATSVPADIFGLEGRGRIIPGARADLVLVRGNPTIDITATRDIVGVWKFGVATDRVAYREEKLALQRAVQKPGVDLLISDFESGEPTHVFGDISARSGQFAGVKSSANIKIVDEGAAGSNRSLEIRGLIVEPEKSVFKNRRWWGEYAGASFNMGPLDLSAKTEITFWARGEGDAYRLLLFTENLGFTPAVQTFVAGADWAEITYPLSSFSGADISGVRRIVFSGGSEPGEFVFQIDEVRFR
jgi:imidazolonepropionase-like amidohydrolase